MKTFWTNFKAYWLKPDTADTIGIFCIAGAAILFLILVLLPVITICQHYGLK